MYRGTIFAGAAGLAVGSLSAPLLAQYTRGSTLRFVPQADLAALDPMSTTATVTRMHGYHVFDTLHAMDGQLRPRPQIAEAHEVSPDGRTWRIRLREGLRFHDGEPVRAADCAASLARWSRRNPFGQILAERAHEWRQADDRMLEIRLKRPFALLRDALAKPDANLPFIMPERLARADANTQVGEVVAAARSASCAAGSSPAAAWSRRRSTAIARAARPRTARRAARWSMSSAWSGTSCPTRRRRRRRCRRARSTGSTSRCRN
jgi:peptide/nickel transport system substrate-binding protein